MSNGINNPTLLDLLKVMQPNGGIETNIVERLAQRLPILEDAVAREGNETTGHTFVAEASLPAVGWRRFNEGVDASKGTNEQFTETCGMLEGYSKVDCGLAELNGNSMAFRATEDKKFMNSLKIEASRALMYESVKTAPEKIHGFTPRFNLSTGSTAAQITRLDQAPYSVTAAGGDYASIWFIAWGEGRCYLVYPRGSMGGIHMKDCGEQVLEDSNGKLNRWLITHWKWNLGLCVEDQRQVARLCDIDVSEVAVSTANFTKLIDAMIDTYYKIFDETDSRIVLYTNRSLQAVLHKAAIRQATGNLTLGEYAGKPTTMFLGHPIRTLDSLTVAESLVS